jgi:MoaA/NifB/PqqE/SkfB family radical SAM enzyme
MKLEEIGFYTLSDARVHQVSETSPMWRTEMILTPRCNFACTYCRGLRKDCYGEGDKGDMPYETAITVLDNWMKYGLKNVRFSGGEPTCYKRLPELVHYCKKNGVERIAVSTNGSAIFELYELLIVMGVNDFSISLDACCASHAQKMAGVDFHFERVVENIRKIAAKTYVTVGVVLNQDNINELKDVVQFAHNLGVADIRVISAAQYNETLQGVIGIPQEILDAHPILKYRVENVKKGRHVRGLGPDNCNRCHLAWDDSVVAGRYHFPCVIHMREGGDPIGEIGPNMRAERIAWAKTHNTHADPICNKNCLDVCSQYNDFVQKVKSNGY